MPKVKSTRINGRRVRLDLYPVVGHHIPAGPIAEEIYVDGSQADSQAFLTLVHEWVHARFPELSERQVEQIERELGGLCLRLFVVKKKEEVW